MVLLLPLLLLLLTTTTSKALRGTVATAHERVGTRCAREPATRVDCYPPAPRFPNATEELCLAHGCCWKPLENHGVPCAFDADRAPSIDMCALVPRASRLACRNPRFASAALAEEDACALAGCCFNHGECFQPFFEGYELVKLVETKSEWRGDLVLRRSQRGPFTNDLPVLLLHVMRESPRRLRVRISDPATARFEVPNAAAAPSTASGNPEARSLYNVSFTHRPFGVAVARRDTGEVLFNSTPPLERGRAFSGLVLENQFLELSTQLLGSQHNISDDPVLYGLGDRLAPLRLPTDGRKYPLFSRVTNELADGSSAHAAGVHPFFLQVAPSGNAHGIFMRSSNAMEAVVQRDAVTFRLTGGIVDVTVFAGPTPVDAISEYTAVVGRPAIPPYWALGFHVGSRRDRSIAASVATVSRLRVAGLPFDAYWLDEDYMSDGIPLTLDTARFPAKGVREFVHDLHFNGQYFVCVQVPTVVDTTANDTSEPTVRFDSAAEAEVFQHGEAHDVFVKGVLGERFAEKFVGGHWSALVDFFHPNASVFWTDQLKALREMLLPFDGLWLERNEPSSSCDSVFADEADVCSAETERRAPSRLGQSSAREKGSARASETSEPDAAGSAPPAAVGTGFIRSPDVNFPFDPFRQPFVPGQADQVGARSMSGGNLNAQTLPLAVNHFNSMHYNVHSLYGLAQTRVTREVLDELVQKRSLLVSRSTFPGSGHFAGHSLQDFSARWEDLPLAIASALRMSMFGVPLAGINVGGLRGDPTAELYVRWFQVAAFFPLLRSHSRADAEASIPIDFDESTTNILRSALLQRYRLLPYMYTLLYEARAHGGPVARPVAFSFPADALAHRVETQFMLGPALMVTPVVAEKAIAADAYFPNATWFDAEDGRLVFAPGAGRSQRARLLTPLSKTQVHIRGGYVVPTQRPRTTTALSRHGDYVLLVALGDGEPAQEERQAAAGELYIDDGDSLDPVKNERFSLVRFGVIQRERNALDLTSELVFGGYDGPEMRVELAAVKVFGLRGGFHGNSSVQASLVMTNESSARSVKADYFAQSSTLVLSRLRVPIGAKFSVQVRAKSLVGGDGRQEQAGDGKSRAGDEKQQQSSSATGESAGPHGRGDVRNYSIASIVGASVLVVLVVGVCITYFVRRRGYNAIA